MAITSTIFPTSTTATSASTSGTKSDSQSLQETYSQFLKMLTTQLQNQDPTAPMDSNEFTAQLVSFSQVEQQLKMNDNLTKLVQMASTSQTTLGLSFIGLNITTQDSNFTYNPATDSSITLGYNMPDAAKSGTVKVTDSTGKTVYAANTELTKGMHTVTWDGKDADGNAVAAGTYTVSVEATNTAGTSTFAATTYVPGRVTGIQTNDEGTIDLIVNGKAVPLSSVTAATL